MSYARGMGDTATDILRALAAGTSAAITSATTPGATATDTTALINPATGLPYGAINPSTGLPYGTAAPASDNTVPIIVGALVLVGIGGFLLTRKRSTPNRRRVRRNRRRSRR